MPHGNLRVIDSEHEPRIFPDNIEPLMQSLLATLADIDFEHEREVEKAKDGVADLSLKAKMIARLDQRHQEKRQPYVEGLLALKAQAQSVLGQRS